MPNRHGELDALRCELFGLVSAGEPPVGALTRVSDRGPAAGDGRYWLRVEPVTLLADMSRGRMLRSAFDQFEAADQAAIIGTVRTVLAEAGIELHADHASRWTIALEQPLPFEFLSLEQAFRVDAMEALPAHPEARRWRRLLNEIQVELHACSVNERLRQQGMREVNSVWFWGGGPMPAAAAVRAYDAVCSAEPVSRGLARLHGCRLENPEDAEWQGLAAPEGAVLADWPLTRRLDPLTQLRRLEAALASLLPLLAARAAPLELYGDGGIAFRFDRSCARRFWKRRVPLAEFGGKAEP